MLFFLREIYEFAMQLKDLAKIIQKKSGVPQDHIRECCVFRRCFEGILRCPECL